MNFPQGIKLDGLLTATVDFITVIVPVLNEEDYIQNCLVSLLNQWPSQRYEILVIDGGSSDKTLWIVGQLSAEHSFIRTIKNPKRIQSAAVNIGAAAASPQASILVRADGHASYPKHFIATCVAALRETGAQSIVVPMRNQARGSYRLQRAIAFAQSSRLGNGGAAHRTGSTSGYVDHGHHAAFDRAFFRLLGGYDETFTHNEDAEFDTRSIAAGGRIWMSVEAAVTYYPRTTIRSLARQYFSHGRGRAKTVLKHGKPVKLRQLVPLVLFSEVLVTSLLGTLNPLWLLIAISYPISCLIWATVQAGRRRDPWLCLAGVALPVMHLSWAAGFLQIIGATFFRRLVSRSSAAAVPVIERSATPPES